MLIIMEGIVLCFILLMFCVIGIANGPEKFTVFYEKDVQDKAIELGYTTKEQIKKQTIISIFVLYLPCFVLVPFMVCYINGATQFCDIFFQSLLIMYIMGLFDRFFIDWYWVEHTKAWDIPNTEELKPYIPTKMKIVKWLGTIVGFAIIAFIIAWVMSDII
ncbi:MAG: hypothetical protein IKL00_03440 [Oscillospiraceae bacterium]|nr:hypothetical protein [Oscillospiraceae bacterium]